MGSIKKIRILRPIVLLIVMNTILMNIAAESYSIASKRRDLLSVEASDIFNSIIAKPEIIWGEVADIDPDRLAVSDTLYCFLENNKLELFASYHSNGNEYQYTQYESSDNEAQAYLSIYGGYVHVDVRTPTGKYRIISISETEAAIVKYVSQILEEPEYNEFADDHTTETENVSIESFATRSTPIIRVLFLYTDSALNMMVGASKPDAMKAEVFRYINDGNTSFANSDINAYLQLAYIGPTDYDETSGTWSKTLNRFYSQNDGYMDEVHNLRDKYKADVCVLIQGKDNYCGEAKAIKASANTAFCIIWPSYYSCGRRYSAIHEIGHLIGCRHNYAKDSNIIPYIYGHGYINCISGNAWCTIMSYESSCSIYNDRILYWSNPEVYYNGVATGTTNLENNARVWNERAGTVAVFRNEPDEVYFTAADNNLFSLYESIKATSKISVGNGFEVQPGQTVEMCAPTIELLAGTYIKAGAKVLAHTNPSTSTPYPQFVSKRATEPAIEQAQTSISTTKFFRNGQLLIRQGNRVFTPSGIFGF